MIRTLLRNTSAMDWGMARSRNAATSPIAKSRSTAHTRCTGLSSPAKLMVRKVVPTPPLLPQRATTFPDSSSPSSAKVASWTACRNNSASAGSTTNSR